MPKHNFYIKTINEVTLNVNNCVCGSEDISVEYHMGNETVRPSYVFICCNECGLNLSDSIDVGSDPGEYESKKNMIDRWNSIMKRK